MDLFYAKETEPIEGPWNEFTKVSPNVDKGKFIVKLSDNSETLAYYYSDKGLSNGERSFFWHSKSHEALHNVTHWKEIKEGLCH